MLRLVHPDKLGALDGVPPSERVAAQLLFPRLVAIQRKEKEMQKKKEKMRRNGSSEMVRWHFDSFLKPQSERTGGGRNNE